MLVYGPFPCPATAGESPQIGELQNDQPYSILQLQHTMHPPPSLPSPASCWGVAGAVDDGVATGKKASVVIALHTSGRFFVSTWWPTHSFSCNEEGRGNKGGGGRGVTRWQLWKE